MVVDEQVIIGLVSAQSILSLLHYRGIVDTEWNREDVDRALSDVEKAITVVSRQRNEID